MLPSAAGAAVHNVRPADSSENPAEEFLDNDALLAMGTVDTFGAEVCVVPATAGSGSCKHAAWGGSNNVIGIGTFFIPISAPPLKAGTWRLLADNGDADEDEVSEPFTVTHCDPEADGGCNFHIGLEAVERYKEAARGLRTGTGAACTVDELVSSLKQLNGDVQGARKKAKQAFDAIPDKLLKASSRQAFNAPIISVGGFA